MKKVLIVSYFAPPCNLTAANRIRGWQQNLPWFGYYPIVITRNWSGLEKNEQDRLKNTPGDLHIDEQKSGETHYIPYRSSLRDKVFIKSQNYILCAYLSKLLTLAHLILEKFFVSFISFYNLYQYTHDYLAKNPDVRLLIVSCNPFEQLFFAYRLKSKFPDLKWVADYRDDWTTNPFHSTGSRTYRIINLFNRIFEKKWLSNSNAIVAVSDVYAKRLQQLHNREVGVVMNGYSNAVEELKKQNVDKRKGVFVLSYSGTIYQNQDFTVLMKGIQAFCQKHSGVKTLVRFIGAKGSQIQNNDLISSIKHFNFNVDFTERLPWNTSYKELLKSDVLFLTSYSDLKGIPTSKLFEYITTKVPILLAPSDKDVIEEILNETQTGYPCNTSEEVCVALEKVFFNKGSLSPNVESIKSYSSTFQVKKLTSILAQI